MPVASWDASFNRQSRCENAFVFLVVHHANTDDRVDRTDHDVNRAVGERK